MRIGSATVLIGSVQPCIHAVLDMFQGNLLFDLAPSKLDPVSFESDNLYMFNQISKLDPSEFELGCGKTPRRRNPNSQTHVLYGLLLVVVAV